MKEGILIEKKMLNKFFSFLFKITTLKHKVNNVNYLKIDCK